MNFMLDPNVAYVMLAVGLVLILLAIVTPGTGILEVGALFTLVLAGYTVYYLSFNLWALIILVSSLVPFVFAIRKPKREIYLALSILMLIVGSVYLFPSSGFRPAVNPWLAAVVSILSGGFVWFVILKTIQAMHSRPSHDLSALIGQAGEAKSAIHIEGSVQVAGELWTARSEKSIPAESHIRVVGREGFVLVVERDDQSAK
ncbi:MAG: NfeD family protein [Anaerolineales bacterium]|nr:NfeD family protein [Anaerolineales bacterium]